MADFPALIPGLNALLATVPVPFQPRQTPCWLSAACLLPIFPCFPSLGLFIPLGIKVRITFWWVFICGLFLCTRVLPPCLTSPTRGPSPAGRMGTGRIRGMLQRRWRAAWCVQRHYLLLWFWFSHHTSISAVLKSDQPSLTRGILQLMVAFSSSVFSGLLSPQVFSEV